jgi:integrase
LPIKTTVKLSGTAYENFINSLRSEKTKNEYLRLLLYFLTWKGGTKLDDLLVGDPTKLKGDITKYLTYLKQERNLSSSSRAIACAALKHFYSQNDIVLNWDIIVKFIGQDDVKNQDRDYTHDEIATILSNSDMKYKAMILLMASSGVRVGAVNGMVYGDLEKVKSYDIFKISVYPKTRDQYYTFCTPESYKALMAYLDFRQRSGEILSPKSPVFRLDFDPRNKQQVKNAKPMSYDTVKSKIRQLLLRSGITEYKPKREKNERRNIVAASHGFRKFAITQMGRSRMDAEVREMLVGHKLGVRSLYLKYSEEDKLNEYLRAVDNLTIDASNRLLAKVDEFKKQEQEIHDLKREKDKEIQELKEQMQMIFEKQNRENAISEDFTSGKFGHGINSIERFKKELRKYYNSKRNKEINKKIEEATILKDSKKKK